MEEKIVKADYEAIVRMVHSTGIEGTESYLLKEIDHVKKEIAVLREKIGDLKASIPGKSNSDVLIHLEYDIEDGNILLSDLLEKLDILHQRYSFFQDYLEKNHL